jgi:TatD DNase family protein
MLIDTHSHLHFAKFDEDREQVHKRMAKFEVKNITVGTAITTSRDAIAYADKNPDTWCSVGYHPEHVTSDYEDEDEKGAMDEPYNIEMLEELAVSSPHVLAIGECGLDYHRLEEDCEDVEKGKANQLRVFQEQIELAAKLDKALIVHMRDAEEDMLMMIKKARAEHPNLRITMHSFTSTWKQAQALLDLDCYLGIGGIVTFKPRKTTAEEDILSNIVKKMPLNRLLVETDCPWLAPVPVRGERNEPTFVRHIAEFIGNLRDLSFEEISKVTLENSQRCFNCDFK